MGNHDAPPTSVWTSGFVQGRLSGSVEFYQNKTKDLLLNANIPETYRVYTKQTMKHRIDPRTRRRALTLNSLNIKTQNFQWTTDFNISINRNKSPLADRAKAPTNTCSTNRACRVLYMEDY